MITSRNEMKCFVYLSSFVNRSDMLMDPAMWCTPIVLFWMDSRTAFSLIWIWRSPFVVMLDDQSTQALLSLYIGVD